MFTVSTNARALMLAGHGYAAAMNALREKPDCDDQFRDACERSAQLSRLVQMHLTPAMFKQFPKPRSL